MRVGRVAAHALLRLLWLLALRGALAANDDKAALTALYAATNGASWKSSCKQGWDLSTEPCNGTTTMWHGLNKDTNLVGGCSSDGRVLALWLGDCGLRGSLPTEVGLLTTATYIYLHQNSIGGTVPLQLGRLTSSLITLDLSVNRLSGTMPSQIGLLPPQHAGGVLQLPLPARAFPPSTS